MYGDRAAVRVPAVAPILTPKDPGRFPATGRCHADSESARRQGAHSSASAIGSFDRWKAVFQHGDSAVAFASQPRARHRPCRLIEDLEPKTQRIRRLLLATTGVHAGRSRHSGRLRRGAGARPSRELAGRTRRSSGRTCGGNAGVLRSRPPNWSRPVVRPARRLSRGGVHAGGRSTSRARTRSVADPPRGRPRDGRQG